MRPSLDVGVVGAGTAGGAAALFLARAGHRVTVYEAVAEPAPIGAGIMVQPVGMAVLDRLGLHGAVLARGARVDRLRCVTPRRRVVLDLERARLDRDAFGLGLHRGVLFDVLFGALRGEPRVTVRCGVKVETLRTEGARHRLLDARGELLGEHELVVVADGARSQLRDDTRLVRRDRPYAWGALWAVLEDRERAFEGELFQVVRGTDHMLGFLPTGVGPRGEVPLVSVFWSVHTARVDAWRAAGLGAWKDTVRSYEPRADALLSQIASADDLLVARYHDIVLRPWHLASGIVYVGDAAHATSPQLGQGANLALVDAAVLADSLSAEPTLAAGLARYSATRRASLDYYQWATRAVTPFFQSDLAPLGWLRDAFMGLACRLPFAGTKMVRTMCGLERGIVRPGLALPALPRALPSSSARGDR